MGKRRWAIAEGYIPTQSTGPAPEMTSHETACLLNAGYRDAHVEIMAYFSDREPADPYRVTVPARRTLHLRFNDLQDPEPIPRDTDYASVLISDEPIVVQHTRLDSRQAENALITTIALRRALNRGECAKLCAPMIEREDACECPALAQERTVTDWVACI